MMGTKNHQPSSGIIHEHNRTYMIRLTSMILIDLKVTLKWCTPRTAPSQELQHCTAAYRITPVDINSRPSSCLTNFLLTGRAVMLELPRKSGQVRLKFIIPHHCRS